MSTRKTWHRIAERLAESGWTWQHQEIVDRNARTLHVAEAHNEDDQRHAVVADAVGPAFAALEQSIQSVGHTE